MKNISKIISIIFLSFSILLLCYVFYRAQIYHRDTYDASSIFDYYLKYYIFAFLFLIFSLISFFIPRDLKIKITTVIASIIISLFIVEGYLAMKNIEQDRFVIYKENTGKDYDKRTKLQIYHDLKKEDPNVILSINPIHFMNDKNLEHLPFSGLSNRKTIHCNENGYYSIYQSDRFGFNTPDKEWNKDEIEFLLVGDSFVHGSCVNELDTISGNLRKLNENKGHGVLNLGQNANGPLIEYATLREYWPNKKVKRVLWLFYSNDLENLELELKNKILISYLKDKSFTQNLISKKKETEKLLLKKFEQFLAKAEAIEEEREKIKLRTNINLPKFIKLHSIRSRIRVAFNMYQISKIKSDSFIYLNEFKNILKLSNELSEANGSVLYFIFIPEYNDKYFWNLGNLVQYKHRQIIEEVFKMVSSLNIPIIDINKEIFEQNKDLSSLYPFLNPGVHLASSHFNEKGYQLIAEAIFNKINELEK